MSIVLRDYQKAIVEQLRHLPAIALYMKTGTGKTVTSLEFFNIYPVNKLLVICPHSITQQWAEVISKQYPHLRILEFKKSWTAEQKNQHIRSNAGEVDVIIVNFEVVHKLTCLEYIVNRKWMIIVDEIHRIKNWGTDKNPTLATRAIVKLGDRAVYKLGLTATPTQGNLGGYIEYYPTIRFLGYTDLSYEQFYNKHVIYEKKVFGTSPWATKVIVGYKDTKDIEDTLKVISKRYTPDYGDFVPQHNKIVVERAKGYLKMIREKAYVKGDSAILINNQGKSRVAQKTFTTGTIHGSDFLGNKYALKDNDKKEEWLRDFLSDTDEIVSVFYNYNVELDTLKKLCESLGKRYIVINGETKDKLSEIRRDDYDVILGQAKAMSESLDGIHLKCHIVVFFSMPESSLTYTQALGRIDRIGQTKVPMYYYMIMEKTIDETIMKMIEDKVEFSENLLETLEVEYE